MLVLVGIIWANRGAAVDHHRQVLLEWHVAICGEQRETELREPAFGAIDRPLVTIEVDGRCRGLNEVVFGVRGYRPPETLIIKDFNYGTLADP